MVSEWLTEGVSIGVLGRPGSLAWFYAINRLNYMFLLKFLNSYETEGYATDQIWIPASFRGWKLI